MSRKTRQETRRKPFSAGYAAAPVARSAGGGGPDPADSWVQAGLARHQSGALAEAEGLYRQALADRPDHPGALRLLAMVRYAQGNAVAALALLDAAVCCQPDLAAAWAHRGVVLKNLNRRSEAEDSLRRTLILEPGHPESLINLAAQLREDNRLAETLALLQPRWDPAAPHRMMPELALHLGAALHDLGRPEEALAPLEEVLRVQPDQGGAQLYYGAVLRSLNRIPEAQAAFTAAHRLYPGQTAPLTNLAVLAKEQGQIEQARHWLQKAYDLSGDPALLFRRMGALPIICQSREEILAVRETLREETLRFQAQGFTLSQPVTEIGQTCFLLAYHALDDKPLQEAVAALYRHACPALTQTAPHCLPDQRRPPDPDQRIRIGFVSEHFFLHTIGQLNHGLIKALPRDRFHVTVCLTPRPMDRLRQEICESADALVELVPGNLEETRRRIASQRLDLLYYTDIGMTPFTYFLAFSRLAPVQTVTWGHPDTTGIPNLDYFLSCDAMEPPDGARHYSETLVRLPGPTVLYPRPQFAMPFKSRAGYGLPEDAHLYVCPQSLFKIHPDYDALLVEILRRDPKGLLVFVTGRYRSVWEILHARIARTGPDVAHRIVAVPPLSTIDFVGLMAVSDVMLDPLHYSGGNTSLEAFSQGVPIVTWPGAFMRGRHTYGWYKLMGVDGLVAKDWQQYVDLAVLYGTRADARHEARRVLRERAGRLYQRTDSIAVLADVLEQAARSRRGW